MSDDVRPIVIKRIKKVAGGHHGGAWKIAYADFVTAMMAFFLLMWPLGSTAQGDLQGISADYFETEAAPVLGHPVQGAAVRVGDCLRRDEDVLEQPLDVPFLGEGGTDLVELLQPTKQTVQGIHVT